MALLVCWIAADEFGPDTEMDDEPTAEPEDAGKQNTALYNRATATFHNYIHNQINTAVTELLLQQLSNTNFAS